ncbi:MAG: arginine--tRNA ligase, partial [Armatimonadota bacterium]
MALKHELKQVIESAVAACRAANSLPIVDTVTGDVHLPFTIETTADPAQGDYRTNIAQMLASHAGHANEAGSIAQSIAARLNETAGTDGLIATAEATADGALNLRLNPSALGEALRQVLSEGERYGRTSYGTPRKVLVEFVSANPNGPITVAHGRGGAIGDTLASLFEWTGNTVSREFYVNDAVGSRQMQIFAQSLFARYQQLCGHPAEIPEDGYTGEYVIEIAQSIVNTEGDRYAALTPEAATTIFQPLALNGMREQQTAALAAFGIHFDNWFSEQTLHASGAVEKVLQSLKERGVAFEEKGALWLRSTQFGDDKDRVLVRAEGTPTYLAGDLAYHADKLARGFDLLVDVWGADHEGYIARTKAGLAALGYAPDQVQIALFQPVRLLRNGVEEKIGKRTGDTVTLDELIGDVGKDAARFFFLLQSSGAAEDFDLDLARRQDRENPLYRVQDAYARCSSALREATQTGIASPDAEVISASDISRLTNQEDTVLMKKLLEFPDEIQEALDSLAPHRIARYVLDLAALWHDWDSRLSWNIGQRSAVEQEIPLFQARLALIKGVQITLANALSLLGVSPQENGIVKEAET